MGWMIVSDQSNRKGNKKERENHTDYYLKKKKKENTKKTCTNRYVGKKVLCFLTVQYFRAPAWKQKGDAPGAFLNDSRRELSVTWRSLICNLGKKQKI